MGMCMSCGNEILGYEECAVCAAGRGGVKLAPTDAIDPDRPHIQRCRCPYCEHYLRTEDWEGSKVLSCSECRGTFFPGRSLEISSPPESCTLDKRAVGGNKRGHTCHSVAISTRALESLPRNVPFQA